MEYYLHHVPGRLRVKIPNLKHQPGVAQDIQDLLNLYGVNKIQIKQVTGSVVVQYDPDCIQHEQLLKVLTDNGYFDHARSATIDDHMRKASSRTAEKVGKVLFGWGVSKALEASGLPLLAALI
ncbi:MAG: HMA2 domain-containing protein [Pseudomonadota bacterium]